MLRERESAFTLAAATSFRASSNPLFPTSRYNLWNYGPLRVPLRVEPPRAVCVRVSEDLPGSSLTRRNAGNACDGARRNWLCGPAGKCGSTQSEAGG
jgi:hypothetical protein